IIELSETLVNQISNRMIDDTLRYTLNELEIAENRVFKQAEFDIMFAEGISKVGELVDLGVEKKIIEKAGAWYSYNEERLGQGREAVKSFLKTNPDIAQDIERQIREKAGFGVRTPEKKPEERPEGRKSPSARSPV
ncbi:MAG: DNA recombination/repair protein RecA, partial [Nitrospirales bacterium]